MRMGISLVILSECGGVVDIGQGAGNWFAKANYKRFFGAAEFHDERTELP
jgi:hypothetical protein